MFPWVLERAERNLLKHFGLKSKEYAHTRSRPDHLAAHPEDRAQDLMVAFEDPEVSGVIAVIGGDDSMRVLPHLDPRVFRQHPKVFMGFSDTTTILTWLNQAGLVTFHGPSMLAGWSQMDRYPPAFRDQARAVLFGRRGHWSYPTFPRFSEGYLDWSDRANVGKIKERSTNDGPHWLSGRTPFSGPLFGGNIEVLEMIKGTRYWPKEPFWRGKVLFLETSEEVPPVRAVQRWLRNYALQGVFRHAAGLLFGRARGYSPEQKVELDGAIRGVIAQECGLPEFPVVTNLDFGHTDPQWVIPLGVRLRVDPRRRTLGLMEPAVETAR